MAESPHRRNADPTSGFERVREGLASGEDLEITEKDIDFIDTLYYDPAERAEWVHVLLEQAKNEFEATLSSWDTICFAAEFLGQQAIAIGDEELLFLTKQLLRRIYGLHYSYPEVLYGDPEKKPLPRRENARPDGEESDDR